jgi:formylglycine-generating enzyme required for sulfatase activity
MLVICPNAQCSQKVVFEKRYGKLPAACPCCGTDLSIAAPPAQVLLQAGERAVSLDGADMVYVPPGTFVMGSDLKEIETAFESAAQKYSDVMWTWFERELPRHEVDLPGFWIDVVPVTCTQYKRFCDATGHHPPKYWADGNIPDDHQNHPAVDVSWEDVLAYCSWVGKRPPYETEWEKAARGTDGRIWPWGNVYREECGNIDRGFAAGTRPVGSFPDGASPYGCLDMAGNVFEWTRDLCVQYPGFQDTDELRKLRQEKMQRQHFKRITVFKDGVSITESEPFQLFGGVVRGGAWASCAEYCRAAFRLEPENQGSSSVGLRCVLGEDPCDQSRDLIREGRYSEALAAAEKSLVFSPNYPTALYNAGTALENLDRYQEASVKYHHLLAIYPKDHDSWNRLGLCQSRLNHTAAAINAFDAAIYYNPFEQDYWYNKALELGHIQRARMAPHIISSGGSLIVVDLPNVPIAVVEATAVLYTEMAGCFYRAQRLGAKDNGVVDGQTVAKQQSQKILDHLRGRLSDSDYIRMTAYAGFCESFPTIQHVWAVIRKYCATRDFSYEPIRKYGFSDSEISTGLSYLKTWKRVETVAAMTFHVIRTDEIFSYDPWGEYV